MEQATAAPLKKTPLNARHRASGARMVAVRRLGHAGRVLRHRRRAHGGPRARRAVRRQPHGRDRDRRQGRARRRPAHLVQRRLEAAGRAGAVLRPADAGRHVRRRPPRLPARAGSTSCWSSTPRTSPTDYAYIAEHIKPAGDAVAVDASSRYALLAVQGPRALEVLQPLTGVDLGVDQVLLVRARRSGQRPRDDLAHRLHRRGRLRDLRAAAVGRPRLAGAPRGRAGRRTSSRAASARATRCGSKRRCACTATTSTRRRPPLEADLGWIVGWNKGDFLGADVLRQQKSRGRRAEARRLRDARARHRAAGLRRVRRRSRRPAR